MWAVILLTIGVPARAASIEQEFLCRAVAETNFAAPRDIHGDDPLTRRYGDDLLWDIGTNKRRAAGSFFLAEIGCGADCIRLAAIEARSGDVRWMPETISSWPLKMLEPVRYRNDSRLVVVFGRLSETGPSGPSYFLLDNHGFRSLPRDRICPKR